MRRKPVNVLVLSGVLALTAACTQVHRSVQSTPGDSLTSNQATSNRDAPQNQSLTETQLKACFDVFPNLKKAWELFAEKGNVRMAKASDFSLPQTVLAEDGNLVKFVDAPCLLGQLRGDYSGTEFATMVIHNEAGVAARFGIVIFNGVEKQDALPQPFWLIEGADLSRTKLYKLSRNFIVFRYGPHGRVESCTVRWDPQNEKYSCPWEYLPKGG